MGPADGPRRTGPRAGECSVAPAGPLHRERRVPLRTRAPAQVSEDGTLLMAVKGTRMGFSGFYVRVVARSTHGRARAPHAVAVLPQELLHRVVSAAWPMSACHVSWVCHDASLRVEPAAHDAVGPEQAAADALGAGRAARADARRPCGMCWLRVAPHWQPARPRSCQRRAKRCNARGHCRSLVAGPAIRLLVELH